MTAFEQLGLSKDILKGLEALGFEKPSEIQEQAIPLLLEKNRDFIGLAQTGTGKTAAFGLPLLQRIDPNDKATQALVLAPTRELGQQIAEQLFKFSKYQKKLSCLAVYGGASIQTQIKALKKPQQVIIATPGRLIDLIKRKSIFLNELQFLVLDEADEMLNMGFKEEIDKILEYTPDDKLTWLFSATMPKEIKRLVKLYMDDPIEVKVNTKNEVNANIDHQYSVLRPKDKLEALTRFIDINPKMRGVVFCRTKRDTSELADALIKRKYRADAIHGDLSQNQRDRVMRKFKSESIQLLIATDVAARGIDVNDLTHVFHFTLPDQNAYYTHRAGRTARAGKKGISLAFVTTGDGYRIKKLEKSLGIKFSKAVIPNTTSIADQAIESWCLDIINQNATFKIDPEIREKTHNILSSLSKDELIEKLLRSELMKLNLSHSKDLNDDRDLKPDNGGGKRGGRKDFSFKNKKRSFSRGKGGKNHRKGNRDGGGGSSKSYDKGRYKKKRK